MWFGTFCSAVQGQYHEIWTPDAGDTWKLEKAYFSVRKMCRPLMKVQELVCIHSDPICNDKEPLGTYKRGPHMHFAIAQSPYSKCHVPLNLGDLQHVLASPNNLTEAMGEAIKIVINEVMTRI